MAYLPERGDIIWLDFDPSAGVEITKRRPALVLSPRLFNQKTRHAMVAPITSTVRGTGMEVHLDDTETTGVVVCFQARCLSWEARNAVFIEEAPTHVVQDALARVSHIHRTQ